MSWPRPLAQTVPGIAAKALGPHGEAFAMLLTHWDSIAGQDIAASTMPFRLVFPRGELRNAILHIRCSSSAALTVQHDEPVIIERINTYFGYHAVARLKLLQAPMTSRPLPFELPPLSPAKTAKVTAMTAKVADDDLREQLASFGRALLARKGR